MLKRASLIFCFCITGISSAFANTTPDVKKYYCSSEQIELTDSTIFIHTTEGIIELDALLVDQGGVYFTNANMRCPDCRRPYGPSRDTRDICEYSKCNHE